MALPAGQRNGQGKAGLWKCILYVWQELGAVETLSASASGRLRRSSMAQDLFSAESGTATTKKFQAIPVSPEPPPTLLKDRTALERKWEGLKKRIVKNKARAATLGQERVLTRTELAKLSDELAVLQTDAPTWRWKC